MHELHWIILHGTRATCMQHAARHIHHVMLTACPTAIYVPSRLLPLDQLARHATCSRDALPRPPAVEDGRHAPTRVQKDRLKAIKQGNPNARYKASPKASKKASPKSSDKASPRARHIRRPHAKRKAARKRAKKEPQKRSKRAALCSTAALRTFDS